MFTTKARRKKAVRRFRRFSQISCRKKAQKAQKKTWPLAEFFDRITGWKTDDKKSRQKVKDL